MEMTGESLHFIGAGEWRAWLQANHAVANDAWLMISKKHAKEPSLSLAQATEEALCFGWIDSAMHPIDDDRYALRYTPRRKGSNWSERNKALTARLIDEGRMTDAGLAALEEAKRNGRWDAVRRPTGAAGRSSHDR